MQAEGLKPLFPMQELSLMGFAEVLPHAFRLKRRIRETVTDIIATSPDLILTIDSPGFCFRVIRKLKEQGQTIPAIHYVAPTVWAYKPERAAKTAALYQHLMTLLPFEPPLFEKEGLATSFVGHPVAWAWKQRGNGAAFRLRHHIKPEATVLGMMPGSRKGEIKRHLPVFAETVNRLHRHLESLVVVMPVRRNLHAIIAKNVSKWPVPVILVEGDVEKKDAFAAMNAAIAKSGTVGLEVALAGIPSIIAYRANPISLWLIRRMVTIPYAHLVNILCGHREIIPERIQERCTPSALYDAILPLLTDTQAQQRQKEAAQNVMQMLGGNETISPSDKAAKVVLDFIDTSHKTKTSSRLQ